MIEQYLDSKELKRLLSTLVVVVGCLIIAGLFGILIVPGLRNANKPATPTVVSPVTGETGWLNPAEYPVEKGRVIPPVDPGTLIKASKELTARGKSLYDEDCSTCHGSLGEGNGPAAGTMAPPPRDFTASEGWINGRDMPGIFKTLEQGIAGSSMVSFDYLTKKDRMALVHYVQSLGGYENTEGSPAAMQALSEELASPGEKTNNKIPVSMAMERLDSEFTAPGPLKVAEEDRSPAAVILRRTIADGSRASQVLHASSIWRSGPDALARSVLPDSPGNGFSVTTAVLTKVEWQTLYDELMKRIRAN
jgi:mono/diheme cytochrome c family protein